MKREDLAWLLNLANDMRAKKGHNPLEDLPNSIPEDSGQCIIANAFNYGCTVIPRHYAPGSIYFNNKEDAETYVKVINDPLITNEQIWESNTQYIVPLSDELNEVALAFDRGDYAEYDLYGSRSE